jgi:hypothetical protein
MTTQEKIKRINERGFVEESRGEINLLGTSFQGNINCSYKVLKSLFGKESENDGYKIDACWEVLTPAGPAHIYNYKDGKNYLGKEGTPKTKITEWHIGGGDKNTYAWVCFAILAY